MAEPTVAEDASKVNWQPVIDLLQDPEQDGFVSTSSTLNGKGEPDADMTALKADNIQILRLGIQKDEKGQPTVNSVNGRISHAFVIFNTDRFTLITKSMEGNKQQMYDSVTKEGMKPLGEYDNVFFALKPGSAQSQVPTTPLRPMVQK